MDSAHDIAGYHAGATDRGELWLELVEIDSPDEYVSHEVAVPVETDASGSDTLDWPGARIVLADGTLGAFASAKFVAQLRAVLPGDHVLLDCWSKGGGREARREWRLDMAI